MPLTSELLNSTLLISAIIGGCVILFMYIVRMLKDNQKTETVTVKNVNKASSGGKEHSTTTTKAAKKKEARWGGGRRDEFTHPWLITTLKGHTDPVLDMDISSNDKYLASCAEDAEPRDVQKTVEVDLPSGDKENRPRLSRRQRKNRRREDNDEKRKARSKRTGPEPPLRQFTKLGLPEDQLAELLRVYELTDAQRLALGYPVESALYPGRAVIFRSPGTAPPHFNPYRAAPILYQPPWPPWNHQRIGGNASDSSSEPTSLEDDAEVDSSDQDSADKSSGGAIQVEPHVQPLSEERQCVRCGHGFFMAPDGEYLTHEHCVYHWGKRRGPGGAYTCCSGNIASLGCTTAKLHVWNGVGVGFNGPFDRYVRTRARRSESASRGRRAVYAVDCEMCYTQAGLELARVAVIAADGRLVYDTLVRPECYVVDYNTRFSGLTARDFAHSNANAVKTLRQVQNDLMGFISADTILVGHGLENDLRALRLVHGRVVDTAVAFPHPAGLPRRRALRSLASTHLRRDLHPTGHAHCPREDARAAMELMLWRVRKDFRHFLDQQPLQPVSE